MSAHKKRSPSDQRLATKWFAWLFLNMAGAPNIVRTLRSKKTVKDHDADKFNFDKEEFEIPPKQRLKVTNWGKSRQEPANGVPRQTASGTEQDVLSDLEQKTEKISSMILDIANHKLADIDPNSCEDLLSDALYNSFHKHMLRQETRMLEGDVAEGEAEAERLHLLSEKLDMIHWPITLRKVTVINDPQDEDECLRKRELTKNCITSMLEKFEAMKNRGIMVARGFKRNRIDPAKDLSKIYNKVDRRLVINYNSSSDEEEEDLSAEEIRRHRRQRRQEQCRGSLIIQLSMNPNATKSRYAIVAEPLRKSYIIKVSQEERKKWKMQTSDTSKTFEYYPPLANQTAVLKRKVEIPLTLGPKTSDESPVTVAPTLRDKRKLLSTTDDIVTAPKNSTEMPSNVKRVLDDVAKVADDVTRKPDDFARAALLVKGNGVKTNNRIHSPPVRKKRRV